MTQVDLRARTALPIQERIWRQIPNSISLARIFTTPVLLGAVILHRTGVFMWVLLTCLLSDILDGLIARTFRLLSDTGAFLDSTADMLVTLMAVVGIFVFQKEFVAAHYLQLLAVLGLYLLEVAAALFRYGQISSFHTLLTRITAYTWGIFVMSLFFWGYHAWIFYVLVTACILASTEELLLIYFLPDWQSDVRGLYWVLAKKRIACK